MTRQSQWLDSISAAMAKTTLWRVLGRPVDDPVPPAWAGLVVATTCGAIAGLCGWLASAFGGEVAGIVVAGAMWCLLSTALAERSIARSFASQERSAVDVVAVVLSFLVFFRLASLWGVTGTRWLVALPFAAFAGRAMGTFLQFLGEPIEPERASTADYIADPTNPFALAALLALIAVVGLVVFGFQLLIAAAVAIAATFVLGLVIQRRFDSVPVQYLGAAVWLGEMVFLFSLSR